MYGETLAFNVSVSNGNISCPVRKSIFAVNLPLKLSLPTVANAYTGSLKSLHTLFDMYLDHMLAMLEPSRIVEMYKIIVVHSSLA